VQQRLVMLSTLAEFEELIAPFAGGPAPDGWTEYDVQQAHVAVPAGPIAHW
jgi:hypothetical protein